MSQKNRQKCPVCSNPKLGGVTHFHVEPVEQKEKEHKQIKNLISSSQIQKAVGKYRR